MSRDPREAELNEVVRRIMVADNYDPHYATLEQRLICETRLFLARFDVLCKMTGRSPVDRHPGFDVGNGSYKLGDYCTVAGYEDRGVGKIIDVTQDGDAQVEWLVTTKWRNILPVRG